MSATAGPIPVTESAHGALQYLGKHASSFDSRFTLRILRNLPLIRKHIDATGIIALVSQNFDEAHSKAILDTLGLKATGAFGENAPISSEADAFIHLLAQAWALNEPRETIPMERVANLGKLTISHLTSSYNRRSLDHFMSKSWFYYVQACDGADMLHFSELNREMMAALRTVSLRHDYETQAMLITLLMRTLISTNRVSMAANLVSKTSFPESHASNSLAARYYYYLARISAIELDYGLALEQITAAIRKVPQTPAALGFIQTAHKLSVLIELLTGDIPQRRAFGSKEQPQLFGPLKPYLGLAKAVREGDIQHFQRTLAENEGSLKRDGNLTLARRLRQNVIKTGIRRISLTYSKIPLKDVCIKLNLDSEESAEYITAKAIRDGVIDAQINHQHGYMQSLDLNDVYSTDEPQLAFQDRIQFCMSLHDDNVKSLRFLSSDNGDDLRDVQEAREREKELVTEIQENTDLEDEDVDFEF